MSGSQGDGLSLRPAVAEDRPHLLAAYASTRADELALTDWTPEQKLDFVTHQFEAQDQHYRLHYPGAAFLVVEHDGQPVGRLYRHDRPTEIRLMDISLLESVRGRGFGSRILRALLEEGQRGSKRVTIHVEKMNRARALYERLGFQVIADVGVYDLMEWRPS